MRIFSLLGLSFAAILFAACSSSAPLIGANPTSPGQMQSALRGIGPNGVPPHVSTMRGWMVSPDRHHHHRLKRLYVSDEGDGVVDVFALPSLSLVGQITAGLSQPEGIATDRLGNLYVSNLSGNTVTVYHQGKTSPYLTLTGSSGPDDVAVAKNGYVLAGDTGGGVDVYPPGATSPSTRLINSAISSVYGVGVDSHNNVYAAGFGGAGAVVVEYANMAGSGTNLGLTGLGGPAGVLVDNHGNLVVSDIGLSLIDIYPPGKTSPSSTISVTSPDRTSINNLENTLYVPQGGNDSVDILSYPAGSSLGSLGLTNFVSGAATAPAPAPVP
ncbi:MAG TPA: hypothetical protein VMT95_05625 [Candidatus Binatia bacterium]|nr:hypothetical protein [Candidatus Binatia bacterium]